MKFNKVLSDDYMHKVRQINREAFVPFGLSYRSCIGRNFALVDAKLVLSTVLTKFKFVTGRKTNYKPRCMPNMTFIHSDELIVKVTKR